MAPCPCRALRFGHASGSDTDNRQQPSVSPGVRWRRKGSTGNSRVWHFFSVRRYFGGEFDSPVVKWPNKGLTDRFRCGACATPANCRTPTPGQAFSRSANS
eukprot:3089718-Pyramimonas_sp.AAC.1